MAISEILITLGGVAAIAGTIWFFFFSKRGRVAARAAGDGAQEIEIEVKGGYTPDIVTVKRGVPVRLAFRREERSSCSDTVVFGDFGVSRPLPAFRTTIVELTPDKAGEFAFTCSMGMFRGILVVQE